MNYYLKFIDHYPTAAHLANASEQEVLADWQGLGYYSRARNLHHAAKDIATIHGGKFPQTFEEIRKLKGIGDYTASAIASFAFDLPHAVVDGNVFRVLSRVFDIEIPIDTTEGKKIFDELARQLLDKEHPAIHNQAIMEFGALQCVPSNPNCSICPLMSKCLAFQNKTIPERPQKRGKIVPRNRHFHFMQFSRENELLLEKRTGKDIWQHLFQFPLVEFPEELTPDSAREILIKETGMIPVSVSQSIKHILTHQRIYAYVWTFEGFPDQDKFHSDWIIVPKDELSLYPIPRLLDRFLEG